MDYQIVPSDTEGKPGSEPLKPVATAKTFPQAVELLRHHTRASEVPFDHYRLQTWDNSVYTLDGNFEPKLLRGRAFYRERGTSELI